MPPRQSSAEGTARDDADRARLTAAAAALRGELRGRHPAGVRPDRVATPFASLLEAMARHLGELPAPVRAEGRAVAAAVERARDDPGGLTGEPC
ncbi:MAG TPA: hypothetical protein VGH99_22590 [Pseudonocardia sp.]